MYLAAIPLLVEELQQPLVTVNLTLVCFFITYCFFLLLYGPLSDRFGRRPPLLCGILIYCLASFFCSMATSIEMLIAGRVLQGAGAASASAIVFAICKDLFTGQIRQRVFVQIGVIVATAPVVAPIIGGWIMELLSWRWIFIFQATVALPAFAGVYCMQESHTQREDAKDIKAAFVSYARLLANYRYLLLVVTLSVFGIPVFAFIAGSPDLYITWMGYDEQTFGYFFAANATAFIFAPLTFARLAKKYAVQQLIPYAFLGMLGASTLFFVQSIPLPWRLALPMFLVTFFFSFCRPGGSNLILEQVDRDVGAASSLMVFAFFLTGAFGMWCYTLPWSNKLHALALMTLIPVSCSSILWQVWRYLMCKK